MTMYLFTYRTPKDSVPGGDGVIEAWNAFFEGMGVSLIDPGNPVLESTTVGHCGTDINPLGGYSIIEADDLDAALELTTGCPVLASGGGVEIGVVTATPNSSARRAPYMDSARNVRGEN
jgi:hypothetical protein